MPVTVEIRSDARRDELELERELTIGRDPGTDLMLEEAGVSRRHARLRLTDDDAPVVEDLGSSNGTYVNGERIARARRLAEGDEVRIGETAIAIRGAGPPTEVVDSHAPSERPAAPRRRSEPGAEPAFNWLALAALALGPLSVVLILTGAGSSFYAALPVAIAAIVCGSLGKRAAERGRGLRGLALTGQVFGVIGTVIAVVAIVALLVVNMALDAGAESLGGLLDQLDAEIDGISLPEEIPTPETPEQPASE